MTQSTGYQLSNAAQSPFESYATTGPQSFASFSSTLATNGAEAVGSTRLTVVPSGVDGRYKVLILRETGAPIVVESAPIGGVDLHALLVNGTPILQAFLAAIKTAVKQIVGVRGVSIEAINAQNPPITVLLLNIVVVFTNKIDVAFEAGGTEARWVCPVPIVRRIKSDSLNPALIYSGTVDNDFGFTAPRLGGSLLTQSNLMQLSVYRSQAQAAAVVMKSEWPLFDLMSPTAADDTRPDVLIVSPSSITTYTSGAYPFPNTLPQFSSSSMGASSGNVSLGTTATGVVPPAPTPPIQTPATDTDTRALVADLANSLVSLSGKVDELLARDSLAAASAVLRDVAVVNQSVTNLGDFIVGHTVSSQRRLTETAAVSLAVGLLTSSGR